MASLLTEPNAYGCHDPQCHDSTWDHECPVVPTAADLEVAQFERDIAAALGVEDWEHPADLFRMVRALRLGDELDEARAEHEATVRELYGRVDRARDEERLAIIDRDSARASADRSWRLLGEARAAAKRLTAGLIANASLLDVPFTNEPSLSPWSRSIKPHIDQLRIALGMRGGMPPLTDPAVDANRSPAPSPHLVDDRSQS